MLELHCHTTYSDGSLTPTELVGKAVQAGVQALAITDHDTLSGWEEAFRAAEQYDLDIVPGVELSTIHHGKSLHVLGFYPDRDLLTPFLAERTAGRWRRAQQMADKLAELGYPIQLPTLAQGSAPGRPHIAKAIVDRGYAESKTEAFDRWLKEDGPAYVAYEHLDVFEGIKILKECGAVPVWAHPYLFRGGKVEEVLQELIAAGLMGVEVYHPTHSPIQIARLEELCREYNLLATGGSDYHGPNMSGREETTLNQLQVSLNFLPPLQKSAWGLRFPTTQNPEGKITPLTMK